MEIAKREIMLNKMKEKVNKNQQYLEERFKKLQKNDDEHSIALYDSYKKYFDNIKTIKENQTKAFENIQKHLDKISKELTNNSSLLEEIINDKKQIRNEINKLIK
jgi:hypothetical protein